MQEDSRGTVTVEYWRWRYRDPKTGRMCRTMFLLTEEEALELPVPGSMLLRDVAGDDFRETGPYARLYAIRVVPRNGGASDGRCGRSRSPAANVSIDVARDVIKRAALIAGSDAAGPETDGLVARLEKATGCSIAELATYAEEWPTN